MLVESSGPEDRQGLQILHQRSIFGIHPSMASLKIDFGLITRVDISLEISFQPSPIGDLTHRRTFSAARLQSANAVLCIMPQTRAVEIVTDGTDGYFRHTHTGRTNWDHEEIDTIRRLSTITWRTETSSF